MDKNEMHKKKIGSRIRVIRNELGLTMNEFGQKFDPPASDSIVSRWERGVSAPNNDRLKRIAELGNISIFYLTTGKKIVSDLTPDEKEQFIKSVGNPLLVNSREAIKKELRNIEIDKLDIVETTYLNNVLDFLKYSDKDDVIHLASIIRMLNSSVEVKANNKHTQEELNNFIVEELKGIGDLLKRRFL